MRELHIMHDSGKILLSLNENEVQDFLEDQDCQSLHGELIDIMISWWHEGFDAQS